VKKKFKETNLGKFLIGSGSHIASTILNTIPDKGVLGLLKNLIIKDDSLPPQDKETALKLLEIDLAELNSVSSRWSSDMASDNVLSKSVRPLTLIFLTVTLVFLIIFDSLFIDFNVEESWIDLLKTLTTTIYVAYFGSRGFEKYKKLSNG